MLENFGLSDCGSVRTNNEDFFLLEPEIGLYIVADGMGGAQAGEHASHLAAQEVRLHLANASIRSAETLLESIHEANRAVREAAAADSSLEGMGTTLIAALEVTSSQSDCANGSCDILIASVGDSRAYLYNGRDLESLTEDQTWVHEVGRHSGLSDDDLRNHPWRHVLTMAVGVGQQLRINTSPVRLKPGMTLLLSSDGLHGVVPLQEIASALDNPSATLEEQCATLVAKAKDGGGPDNITVVLLRSA